MSSHSICIFGTAPDPLVDACLSYIQPSGDVCCFIKRGAVIQHLPPSGRRLDFSGRIESGDSASAQAFAACAPTDVILVCEQYNHDADADALVAWCRKAGLKPRLHVFMNNILLGGYLEAVRRHPGAMALRAGE